jgi:hypothetical protein
MTEETAKRLNILSWQIDRLAERTTALEQGRVIETMDNPFTVHTTPVPADTNPCTQPVEVPELNLSEGLTPWQK